MSDEPDKRQADSRLRLRNLTVSMANGERLLSGVSFTVRSGEVVVVLGKSGAGKSTLGEVIFDMLEDRRPGASVSMSALEADPERMSLVLQRGSLFDHLSVRENIAFAARQRTGNRLSEQAIDQLLEEVGLPVTDGPVSSLSGGEERRVAVARGLASNPSLIFFDEPTAGLDVENVHRIGQLIRRVCDAHHAGAIVVTHDPLLASLVGDEVLYLDKSDGSLSPLLDSWSGPVAGDDYDEMARRRDAIESALLERGRLVRNVSGPSRPIEFNAGGSERGSESRGPWRARRPTEYRGYPGCSYGTTPANGPARCPSDTATGRSET